MIKKLYNDERSVEQKRDEIERKYRATPLIEAVWELQKEIEDLESCATTSSPMPCGVAKSELRVE
jgi:hypothetical protein